MGVCTNCKHYILHSCPVGSRFRSTCMYETKDNSAYLDNTEKTEDNKVVNSLEIKHKKWDAICDDYEAGYTVDECASKYKMHRSNILRILHKCNVPIRNSRSNATKMEDVITEELKEAVINDLKLGMGASEIATKYNITNYKVKKIKSEAGLVKTYKPKTKVKVEKKVQEKASVEEPVVSVAPPSTVVTFFLKGEGTKPFKSCYPSEREGLLVWAIDISTIEELMALSDEGNGTLVIDGHNLDILPMHALTGTGGDAA